MHGNEEGRDAQAVPGLEKLYAGRRAPPAVEQRILGDFVTSMGASGGGRSSSRRVLLHMAAALVIFAVGWWSGASAAEEGTDPAGGSRFMLLLWEGESSAGPLDAEATAAAYGAWAGSLARSGVSIMGEELGSERATVGGESSVPPVGTMRVGGFFVVGAPSLEAARDLVDGHPHLANGGAIEIAPIVDR